jgi:hypothetical protein
MIQLLSLCLHILLLVAASSDQYDVLSVFFNDTYENQLWHQSCLRGWHSPRSSDCRVWAEVTCTQGKVSKLDVKGCGITGELGQFLSIQSLTAVALDGNEIQGSLTRGMSQKLEELYLCNSHMAGHLDSLSQLAQRGTSIACQALSLQLSATWTCPISHWPTTS